MDSSPLAGWDNFYVIVGSAAGGLTGLTFVVIALVRDGVNVRPTGLRAYVSPTMVHFGGVLALAAYLSMPHQNISTVSAGLVLGGLAGVVYGIFTALSLRKTGTAAYTPVREDWVWNVIMPTLVYLALCVMGFLIWYRPEQTLFGVATLALFLLFIGIRNAWDIAVFMTTKRGPDPPGSPGSG